MRRFIYDLAYDGTNIGPTSVDFELTVHIDTEVITNLNGHLDGTGNYVDPSIDDPYTDIYSDDVVTTTQVVDDTLSKSFTRAALTAGITNNGNDLSGASPWTIPDNKFVVFRSEPFQYSQDLSPNHTVFDTSTVTPISGNQIYNSPYPYTPNLWSHFGNVFSTTTSLRDLYSVPAAPEPLARWYFLMPSNLNIAKSIKTESHSYVAATQTGSTETTTVNISVPMGDWIVGRPTTVGSYPLPSSPTSRWSSRLYQFPDPSGTIQTPEVDYNVSTLRQTDESSLSGTYTYNRPQPANNPGFLYHKKWEWTYVFTVTVTY